MAKFLIFKKLENNTYGEKLASYEADSKDDSSRNRSWLHAEPMASHFELPEGVAEETAMLAWVEEQIIPEQGVEGEEGYIPQQTIAAHWELQNP